MLIFKKFYLNLDFCQSSCDLKILLWGIIEIIWNVWIHIPLAIPLHAAPSACIKFDSVYPNGVYVCVWWVSMSMMILKQTTTSRKTKLVTVPIFQYKFSKKQLYSPLRTVFMTNNMTRIHTSSTTTLAFFFKTSPTPHWGNKKTPQNFYIYSFMSIFYSLLKTTNVCFLWLLASMDDCSSIWLHDPPLPLSFPSPPLYQKAKYRFCFFTAPLRSFYLSQIHSMPPLMFFQTRPFMPFASSHRVAVLPLLCSIPCITGTIDWPLIKQKKKLHSLFVYNMVNDMLLL